MIDIFLDCETTGINPYCSEIIQAYFYVNDDLNHHLKARPLEWSYEAQEIHGITYVEASDYPEKKDAYRAWLKWLPCKPFRFITWVNKNTELGKINFDVAILVNELNLLGTPNYYLENKRFMRMPISALDLARECANAGLFQPLKGSSGRVSYTQANVYKALFGESYKTHDAKEDVKALVRIYKKLIQLKDENISMHIWLTANNSQSLTQDNN